MEKIANFLWSMFTNNGMYSSTEATIMIVVSFVATTLFMRHQFHQAEIENRTHIISDLGFDGYLRHKAEMEKFDYRVP